MLFLALAYTFATVGLAFSPGLLPPALLAFVLYEVLLWTERRVNARRPSASSVL